MLIWGSGGNTLQLGDAGVAHCPACEKERMFKNVLVYRYAHIWYLFNWVTKKAYFKACEICGRGPEQDAKAIEAKLGKSPIPAFRRYGGFVLLGLIALAVVGGVAASKQSTAEENALLDHPQVGDLYTVYVDEIVPDAFDQRTYGVMRVAQIDGDMVSLQVPNIGYDKLKGVFPDLRGDAKNESYYAPGTVQLSLDKLKQLHDANSLMDVTR